MNTELSKLSLEELSDLKEEVNRFFNNDLFKFPNAGITSNLSLPAKYYNLLLVNIIEDSKLKFTLYGIDMIIFDLDTLEVSMSDKYEHNMGLAEETLISNYEGFTEKDKFLDSIEEEKNVLKDKFVFENNIKAINEEIENIKSLFGINFKFIEDFDGYKLERNEDNEDTEEIEKENIIEDDKITKESNEHEITHSKKDSLIKRIIKRVVKF